MVVAPIVAITMIVEIVVLQEVAVMNLTRLIMGKNRRRKEERRIIKRRNERNHLQEIMGMFHQTM